MKIQRLFCLILLLSVLIAVLFAVEKAQTMQHEPDYAASLDSLLSHEKKGIINADLYNQLGLSYYRQGKPGKAVLYFLRALRINSNHKDAKNNLEYAINQSPDRELYTQPSFLSALFQRIFEFFNLNSLAVLVLILLILTTICLHWIMHRSADQDRAVPLMWMIIISLILLLFVTMLGLKYRDFQNNRKAVIIEHAVEGYSGPGQEFGSIFTIHEGLIIHISRINKDWALITLPNGGVGWIQLATLERVRN